MDEIASLVTATDRPFVLMGDWNMTLDEIGPAGWDTYLRGKWITPGGRPAGGRLIDYMMTSEDLIGAITL
eukprot:8905397-Pyramimonas_sp.AAC.1